MNNNTKNVFLIALILLFVINIAGLITIITINKRPYCHNKERKDEAFKGPKHFQHFMHEELGLTETQMDSFILIKADFVEFNRNLSKQMKNNQDILFEELKKENHDEAKIEEITQIMGKDFIKMKQVSNKHFLSIKEILTEEQQEIFFNKMKHGFKNFGPKGSGRKSHKGLPCDLMDVIH